MGKMWSEYNEPQRVDNMLIIMPVLSSLEYLQAVAEDIMASVTSESTSGLFLNVTLGLISVQTE